MTKRQARMVAYGIAYRFVQQAIDSGGPDDMSEADQDRVDAELERIAQRLFERATTKPEAK